MGPSLLIATDQDLINEIQFAAHIAKSVMMTLMTKFEAIFPQRKEPWYQANEEDAQK